MLRPRANHIECGEAVASCLVRDLIARPWNFTARCGVLFDYYNRGPMMKIVTLTMFITALMLAGCSTHPDCSQVRQDRVNGMTSEQIAKSMGVGTSEVDNCY